MYGTTNARIRLIFTANGQWMGAVAKNTPTKLFYISVQGENRLKRIVWPARQQDSVDAYRRPQGSPLPVMHGPQRGFGSGFHLQFPVDIREVSLDGADAQVEFLGNVLVAQSLRNEL